MTSYVWTDPPDKKQRVEIIWKFARKLNKPVLVSEVECVARSNPYDMTLEQVLSRLKETAENIAEVRRLLKEWGKILEAEVIQKS